VTVRGHHPAVRANRLSSHPLVTAVVWCCKWRKRARVLTRSRPAWAQHRGVAAISHALRRHTHSQTWRNQWIGGQQRKTFYSSGVWCGMVPGSQWEPLELGGSHVRQEHCIGAKIILTKSLVATSYG
jgi:hypothetical protein